MGVQSARFFAESISKPLHLTNCHLYMRSGMDHAFPIFPCFDKVIKPVLGSFPRFCPQLSFEQGCGVPPMYSSYNPPMLAFAMGKESNSGSNIRRTGKAVFAAPGVSLNNAVMAYGSFSGNEQDKLKETPIVLQNIEGSNIQIPEDTRVAFVVSLAQTMESGDHYLYLCNIEKIVADESKDALFAWDGYAKVAPAQEK